MCLPPAYTDCLIIWSAKWGLSYNLCLAKQSLTCYLLGGSCALPCGLLMGCIGALAMCGHCHVQSCSACMVLLPVSRSIESALLPKTRHMYIWRSMHFCFELSTGKILTVCSVHWHKNVPQ